MNQCKTEDVSASPSNPIPAAIRILIIGTWLAGLVLWEKRRALRRTSDNKLRRDLRNLAIAASAGVVMQFCELPVAFALAQWAELQRWGLVWKLPLPPLARAAISVALLDYTLYWWHYFTHRAPFLWRFHRVHHVDREMDATTAIRFHFGEIAISVLFRAGQVILIGPTPLAVASWQVFLFLCILFHHANVRLPLALERRIARFVMTPRLHGIHHSIQPNEVNSNWSSGFTVWDWLHGTLRTAVPQDSIVIGVPGYRDAQSQRLGNSLLLPFRSPVNVPEMARGTVRQPLAALK
jgi:sterol desaturase/sphingolipid hydroxylase (fatty acid hydroxylase superfamily)